MISKLLKILTLIASITPAIAMEDVIIDKGAELRKTTEAFNKELANTRRRETWSPRISILEIMVGVPVAILGLNSLAGDLLGAYYEKKYGAEARKNSKICQFLRWHAGLKERSRLWQGLYAAELFFGTYAVGAGIWTLIPKTDEIFDKPIMKYWTQPWTGLWWIVRKCTGRGKKFVLKTIEDITGNSPKQWIARRTEKYVAESSQEVQRIRDLLFDKEGKLVKDAASIKVYNEYTLALFAGQKRAAFFPEYYAPNNILNLRLEQRYNKYSREELISKIDKSIIASRILGEFATPEVLDILFPKPDQHTSINLKN